MIFDATISLIILIVLLSLGVPILFCFTGALLYMCTFNDLATMQGMMVWGFSQLANPVLLCIPLFVFAGNLMNESGIADSLLKLCNLLIGRIKGGLGLVSIFTCALIGAISGSVMTGIAAIGPLLIPNMEKQGYPRNYSTVLVCCSSLLGSLIPPSIDMIVFGWVTGTSILACFLATVIPAILLMIAFVLINHWYVGKFDILEDTRTRLERRQELPKVTLQAFPALGLPIIILGGIYGGIMTPTEAAAVACIYAIPIGLLYYKGLKFKSIIDSGYSSVTAVGAIMVMIFCSLILSQQFVFGQLPQRVAEGIFSISDNKYVILLLINILLFVMGMIVNTTTAIIIIAPLLLPLINIIDVHPVQFAAIMGVNLALGCITPPYAGTLFFALRVGKVEFIEVVKPVCVFIVFALLPVCLLTTYIEPISLFLPRLLGFI